MIDIPLGRQNKLKRTVGEARLVRLEEVTRAVLRGPAPQRTDSNTSMASEQKRLKEECRMREAFRATATGRFTPDQVAEQMLLLAKAKAKREAGKRPDQRWAK